MVEGDSQLNPKVGVHQGPAKSISPVSPFQLIRAMAWKIYKMNSSYNRAWKIKGFSQALKQDFPSLITSETVHPQRILFLYCNWWEVLLSIQDLSYLYCHNSHHPATSYIPAFFPVLLLVIPTDFACLMTLDFFQNQWIYFFIFSQF